MKKIFALALAACVSIAGAFAFDVGSIRGSWIDERYDAKWTFSANQIDLYIASTGQHVYTFTDDNIEGFKVNMQTTGASISFRCPGARRYYTFTKPVELTTDLDVNINPDWTDLDYRTRFKYVEGTMQ